MSGARDRVLGIFAAGLALACLVGLGRIVATMGLRIPFDSNEGWNAYHTVNAMAGGPLYPDRHSFLFNNYPPLSFYLVGLFGKIVGDTIIAGRILSLLAVAAVAGGIFAALRRMNADSADAAFAALLFVGGLLVFTDYVGMDDPQLLGHAIAMGGFVLLLKAPRTSRAVFCAALLMTLAGFVKHNLMAEPIALTIWLALYDRRNAVRFVLSGLVFALLGLAACRLVYGIDLLGALDSPRLYSVAALRDGVAAWLVWGGVPLVGIAVLYALRRDDGHVALCALYALVAVTLGAVFSGGAGVDMNVWFDAAIALALGAGLALDRFPTRPPRAAAMALFYATPLAAGLVLAADGAWLERDFWLRPMAEEQAIARNDIAFLQSHRGPALCEMLSLCYWAGKQAEVDVFNLGQAYATRARSDDDLVRLIEARRYRSAQFDSLDDFALGPRVRRAFARFYRIDHTDDDGAFLVPR